MSADRLPSGRRPPDRGLRADPRGAAPRGADPRGAAPRGAAPRRADPRGAPRSADPRGPAPRGPDRRDADPRWDDRRRPDPPRSAGPERPGRAGRPRLPFWNRALRGLAGVLAGGLVVLSLGLLAVWLLADRWSVPGPGGTTVFGHLVGAVVAVAGQRISDRRPDLVGTLAAAVVTGTAVLVLGLAWFL